MVVMMVVMMMVVMNWSCFIVIVVRCVHCRGCCQSGGFTQSIPTPPFFYTPQRT